MTGGPVGVVGGVDIQVVGLAASCRGDVQHLPVCARRDHDMGGFRRPALAAIRGRGVSELDVVGDVIGGEQGLAATVPTAQRHASVGVGGGD